MDIVSFAIYSPQQSTVMIDAVCDVGPTTIRKYH